MRGTLAVALGALVLGCSTTTTISRVSGPDLEGDVVGGSPTSVFVAREGSALEDEIPRDDIARVDYPGNVHYGVGAGVLLYGLLNIGVGMSECEKRPGDDQAAFCAGLFTPAAIGVGMIVWGLVVHQGQVSAMGDQSRTSSLPAERPALGRFPAWASGHRRPKPKPEEPALPQPAPPDATPAEPTPSAPADPPPSAPADPPPSAPADPPPSAPADPPSAGTGASAPHPPPGSSSVPSKGFPVEK